MGTFSCQESNKMTVESVKASLIDFLKKNDEEKTSFVFKILPNHPDFLQTLDNANDNFVKYIADFIKEYIKSNKKTIENRASLINNLILALKASTSFSQSIIPHIVIPFSTFIIDDLPHMIVNACFTCLRYLMSIKGFFTEISKVKNQIDSLPDGSSRYMLLWLFYNAIDRPNEPHVDVIQTLQPVETNCIFDFFLEMDSSSDSETFDPENEEKESDNEIIDQEKIFLDDSLFSTNFSRK